MVMKPDTLTLIVALDSAEGEVCIFPDGTEKPAQPGYVGIVGRGQQRLIVSTRFDTWEETCSGLGSILEHVVKLSKKRSPVLNQTGIDAVVAHLKTQKPVVN